LETAICPEALSLSGQGLILLKAFGQTHLCQASSG
jgi:hypothetical protein